MRKEISRHWGDQAYPHREAIIFHNLTEDLFEVEFWERKKLKENRQMVTEHRGERTIHSLRYAEDAAENWCLGYIP